MEQLFDVVGELVRALFPQIGKPGPVMRERLVRERRIDDRVVDPVQLQFEEEKLRADAGKLVLGVAEEFGAVRV